MAYTNSSLVSYTKLSPNHSGQRTHVIDTITIHCYVGQASVESAGNWFSKPTTQASCNYVIGADGRIGLIVEEKNRSWCTSSNSNDQRAITIECASDKVHPYAVNDKVYSSLIKLCADICKRNGIKELKWKGDKSLIGQVDKQNMTVHRWFKNKACPGEYLYSRHGEIAEKVNTILNSVKENKEYFRVGTSWSNGKCIGQVGAFTNKDNAIKKAKENRAWKVFNGSGKVVYEYRSTVSTPTSTTKLVNTNISVTYAVQIEGGKILPAVTNLKDYAGIENKKITGVAMKVDKGTIKYQVHVLGGGWLPWVTGYNWKDHKNGYAGNGKPIDAIRVYYSTPSDIVKKSGYKEAKYHVSTIGNKNYYGWQLDDSKKNGMDGYAGAFGKAIDKLQVHIE